MTDDASGQVAETLRRRGLDVPARLLLDAHRPLRPLLGQLATFLAPTLRPLLGTRFAAVDAALADDAAYDRLLEELSPHPPGDHPGDPEGR